MILACVLIIAVLGVCAYGFALKNSDKIFPNVSIAGVDVGGLRRSAAVSAVSDAVKSSYAGETLTVVLPDRTLQLNPDVTQVALNPEEAVDVAMAYGRDGGPVKAIRTYLAAKKTAYSVSLESSLNLDTEKIRTMLEQTAREVQTDRVEPSVRVDEAAGQIVVNTGSPAVSLDAEALYTAVLDRFGSGDLSDLTFDYDTEPVTPIDLQEYYDKFCSEMKDAYYDEQTHELVAEVPGYGFDVQYYTQQLAMAESNSTVTIQVEELKPEVTLEDLEKIYFADVLGEYDSPHTGEPKRTKNLELACKAIDGTILNPGEEFSFNGVVGERTTDKGYQEAIVYTDGGASEAQAGGGICQVASTIYSATLLANLKVTERAPHMYKVTYVMAGMDATIYWGQLDFKFVNSTEYPLRIDASVSDGYVHIKLIGTKPETDYDHIVLRYSQINEKAWKTVDEDGNEITIVPSGGRDKNGNLIDIAINEEGEYFTIVSIKEQPYTGYTIVAYRDFVDADGKVLRTETLHTDVYNSRDKKYELAPYTVPEEPEPEEPTDPTDPTDPTEPTDPWEDPWFGDWGGGQEWP